MSDHSDDQLRAAIQEAVQWLAEVPTSHQRAWFLQLAECLTVVIRSSVHEPVQVGTIQMTNEFLHCIVGRISTQDQGIRELFSPEETLRMVGLAIARAEGMSPPADPNVIADSIRHTITHFRVPNLI